MNWWIFGGVVVGVVVLGFLAQRFGMIDLVGKSNARSAGNGASLIGIGDEVFAPSRHEAAIEMDRQTILPAPAPLAGDPLKAAEQAGVYNGRVTIELPRDVQKRPRH
ncbi:MAG: hypothetical protein QOI70_613 [Microbacteriaceae bacterium]|nr:hypothetical protein [Microbacteriaceae bacterium]MDQ1597189.1 hypothetical protein [Microbacteriaceae bacterium]